MALAEVLQVREQSEAALARMQQRVVLDQQRNAAARVLQRWHKTNTTRRHLRQMTQALHERSVADLQDAADSWKQQLCLERDATAMVTRTGICRITSAPCLRG